ncbi:hypothetical protein CR513_41904, partial [Mucuna pruriens]
MRYEPPRQDKPMVISVVTTEYKVESVLIDQGSSANILYWSTYKKLGLPSASLEVCSGTLYGFAGEQVMIKGVIELETTFGERGHVHSIIHGGGRYNIIMGRPTLNKLGGSNRRWVEYRPITELPSDAKEPTVNVLDLDLDPHCEPEHERPLLVEDLKEVNIEPWPTHKTRIGITLTKEEESHPVSFLWRNRDVFAWSLADMPGIDSKFLCHRLSISPKSRPIAQKERKLGEEKRRAVREETRKLLVVGFIREIQYPTWIANVVMVKKASGK